MKYALDENGNVKLKDGKIVLLDDDGKEVAFDALVANNTISNLHKEAAEHRKKSSERGKIIDKLGDIDIDAAKEALQTVQSMSQEHKLQVEQLKENLNKTWQDKYQQKEEEAKSLSQKLYDATVTAKFATSEAVKKTILTPDIAAKVFGSHFKEDGTAVDFNGNTIYSMEKPGEAAQFDEALNVILNNYPNKNAILRGSGANGSGSHNSGPGNENAVIAKYYDKNSPSFNRTEQAKIARTNPELHKRLTQESTQ